jgi:transcriptional regulator with XRE-family HTH domain
MSDDIELINSPDRWRPIGARLREAREFMAFSQAEIAEVLDLSRPAVSAIEAGHRRVTGLELKILSDLYQRPYEYFLGRDVEIEDDETIAAIYRATRDLSDEARQQVRQFAEFLRSKGSSASNGADT